MAKEEEIPGIVLRIHEKTLNPCAGKKFKANGNITLTAEVTDFSIWDRVVEKLDGLAVYSVSTLTETIVEAAQRRANKAEEAAMRNIEATRMELDQLRAALSFRQQEVEQMRRQLNEAYAELELLRDFERSANLAAERGT